MADDLYLPFDALVSGERFCKEYVREDWEPDALLVPCGRVAYGRTGMCEAHYARTRRKGRMEQPFQKKETRRSSEEIQFRDELGRKLCSTCKQFLPEDEFAPLVRTPDGLQYQCQFCINLYRYGLDRNKFEALLQAQDGRCANPNCGAILQIRSGGRTQPRRNEYTSLACVDHDHHCCPGASSCGKCVRGLLCWHCNAAAGLLGDDLNKVHGLARYLSLSTKLGDI